MMKIINMDSYLLDIYKNGNYTIKIYSDGTKIKSSKDDKFIANFPDSIDLKITNYCDLNCPMCHEESSTNGFEGDLNSIFLNSLHRGTELAIGGGNPLSHKGLLPFLVRMKRKRVICNLTINEKHLLLNIDYVQKLLDKKLIYGLGVSLNEVSDKTINFASKNNNVVLHIINGVFTAYDKIINKNLKILILGYKKFGRGESFFNEDINNRIIKNKKNIIELFDKFYRISFDNLALEQLDIKSHITNEEWNNMFMGNDGEATMYIDLVEKKFAVSSTSVIRYELMNNINDMFNKIKIY